MYVQELMISDWVVWEPLHAEPYIQQIDQLKEDKYNGYPLGCYHIKLTPEILEANDFVKKGDWFVLEDDPFVVKISSDMYHLRIVYGTAYSYSSNRYTYVDTLQKAMRMCGIPTRANHFKLKK